MPFGLFTNWCAFKTLMKNVAFFILLTSGGFQWFINQMLFRLTEVGSQALFVLVFLSTYQVLASREHSKMLKWRRVCLQKGDLSSPSTRLWCWKIKPPTSHYMSPASRISSIKSSKKITGRQRYITWGCSGKPSFPEQKPEWGHPTSTIIYLRVRLLRASEQAPTAPITQSTSPNLPLVGWAYETPQTTHEASISASIK